MRLIDADDFDTKLFNDGFFGGLAACIGNTPRKRKFTIGEFRGMLAKAPTVDAAPVKHGKWETIIDAYGRIEGWLCKCGRESKEKCNYCPNCGAKMDLED